MKQIKMTVEMDGTIVEVGRALVQKNASGQVEVIANFTNTKVAGQLGGSMIRGIITNYEGDPEEINGDS